MATFGNEDDRCGQNLTQNAASKSHTALVLIARYSRKKSVRDVTQAVDLFFEWNPSLFSFVASPIYAPGSVLA